jgi:hypothetical protein
MLTGIIVGAIAGLMVALVSFFARKAQRCPVCGEDLPTPWLQPLEECPHCEVRLNRSPVGRLAARPRVAGQSVLLAAAVLGLVVFVFLLPGTIESHRVWRYQQGRVEEKNREIDELMRRGDPVSLVRAESAREELRRSGWNPETHREQFIVRSLGAAAGGLLAAASVTAFTLRLVARRAASRRYHDDEDDQE